MGYGDEIMAAGHAQRVYDADPSRRVAICDRVGDVRWSELWEWNPAIASPHEVEKGERVQRITNGIGCRPYIQYPWHVDRPCLYTDWRARDHVGRLFLSGSERARAERLRSRIGPYVVIEPSPKSRNPNKTWADDRWRAVVSARPDVKFVQMLHADARQLPGTQAVLTTGFRDACAVLSASSGYVGTEGGLHHAAAALVLSAVVLFGGFISPNVTGYETHINLADEGAGSPCGMWKPCRHCRDAMNRIAVSDVLAALDRALTLRREAVA